MNERIKELVKQAGINLTPAQFSGVLEDEVDEFTLEKFAELIVKEMLKTCENHPGWSGRMIGEQIKQHFGVEE